ncbi:DNA (cytosine-5-)-methyltransferase [Ruminococcus sp. AM31-15AC]|uniref:DNA (cytosine-5-)-methyltransferase n=1 Tax=Ruminococcus sp. AM31-15AC TaxID=2293202 RepID=UPI000E4EC99C|nr:DNA (cytosine-5-)-methyltransferase [Ruminococcus sp. AM31-15AC]
MKVLSLFDGISCGMLALQRAGIPVECYDAFEIDKYAVTVSKRNFPVIVHHGNVYDGDFTKFQGYDLLLGGSPCTYWSIAKKDREVDCNGEGFRLFKEYVRALEESGCKYFLYENNYSVHQRIKDEITRVLGVEPIMINSALVSAQNRKRCYWTNIPNVVQPEDKGILLADILENGMSWQDKSYCMTASYDGAVIYNTLERKQRTMVAVPVGAAQRGRYVDGEKTEQHIEVREDGKSNCLTTVQKDSLVCAPVRIGHYGKGGQGQRIYSVVGKSVTLSANGGGQGAKTGLYKIDLPDGDYVIRKLTPVEAERLQTLPDNYTAGISNTQRYKCIGNGWTVDVIAHILGGLHND